ncbi:hypothetical protein M231_06190 [Tremella mesenterica]|uniref:Uncharacterized protein n=1 Tax=Tremella mesenterica TaxID=5217 RepID=A0A4Q1BGD5_TREME|nr:hypothetical protein M231_06190 [Tremella mesenterica]
MSLLQLQLPGAAQGLSQACTTPENGIVQSFSQMWSEAEELRRRCLASQDDQSSIERRQFHACGMAFNLAQLLSKHKQLKDSLQLASDETVCQAAASFSKNHPDGLPLILPTSEVEQFKDIFHRLKAMHQRLSTRLSESIQWDCTKSQKRSTTNLAKEQAKADANLILDGIRAFTFVWLSTHSRLCITKVAPESKALQILQDKLTDGHSVTATQIVKAAAQEYLELTQGGSRTNQLQNDKVDILSTDSNTGQGLCSGHLEESGCPMDIPRIIITDEASPTFDPSSQELTAGPIRSGIASSSPPTTPQ